MPAISPLFRRAPAALSTRRRGYAIAAVVFMLAMVSLLLVTGYDLIRLVGDVRAASRDAIIAEESGKAAVSRFMGERVGTPPDSLTIYVTESTKVQVRARRLSRMPGYRSSYLMVASTEHGTTFPAKRTVREFAILEPPFEALAVFSLVSGALTVDDLAVVNGTDAAGSPACAATTGNTGGALAVGSLTTTGGSPISGNPSTRTVASRAVAEQLLGVRWDYLLGSEVPVQASSVAGWPNFSTLHVDTFPLIRITGDFTPSSTHSGRGALIVSGTFHPGSSFTWNGVIIAGAVEPNMLSPTFTLRGLMVAGLNATAGAVSLPEGNNLQYNRCNVMRAFAKLAHLEPVVGTSWTDR